MKRNKKPLFFKYTDAETGEVYEFKSGFLGFLTGNELLLKYATVLFSLKESSASALGSAEDLENLQEDGVDLKEMLKNIPQGTLTEAARELLQETYIKEDDKWELINPDDFDNMQEAIFVLKEVFKYNFPSLFTGDNGIAGMLESIKSDLQPEVLAI